MFIYVIIISGAFCQDLVREYYALTKTKRYEQGDSPEVIKWVSQIATNINGIVVSCLRKEVMQSE